MRTAVLLSLAAGFLVAAETPKQKEQQERKKLEGTWRVVSQEADGKKDPAELAKRFTYTFQGNRIHFQGDNTTPGADLEFTYTVDPSKKPKQMDMKLVKSSDNKGLGKVARGIYMLQGDTLKLCYGEKERPNDFSTKKGQHRAFLILKREKK